VLTFGKAIQLAEAETPSSTNGFVIECVDAGIYVESFTISPYISIRAPGAVIAGSIVAKGFTSLECLLLQCLSGVAYTKNGYDNASALFAQSVVMIGATAGAVECAQGGLILEIGQMQVTNGVAVLNSGTSSTVSGRVQELYSIGTGTLIKSTSSSGEVSLVVPRMNGASGTGIDLDDGDLYLYAGEFNPGTGGDVASGAKLALFAGDLYSNTFTGSGTINVTEAGTNPPLEVIYAEEEAQDDTTSVSYTQAYRYTATLEASADYLISYSCEVLNSQSNGTVHVRLQAEDTDTFVEGAYTPPDNDDDAWRTFSGIKKYTAPDTSVNFDFDFYREGAGTSRIRRKRLNITKISNAA